MKFTTEWSEISIYFLDVTVSIAKGIIETVSYVKPIDSHQYLLWSSCHPVKSDEYLTVGRQGSIEFARITNSLIEDTMV